MSHSTPPVPRSRRPSLGIPASSPSSSANLVSVYSDAREHGHQGPTRTVRLPRATSTGGGMIATHEDGVRCVIAGKLSLRVIRLSDVPTSLTPDHRSKVGRGGHRIDAGRNLWTQAGFKVESVTTDVAWGRQNFDNKILTSARNGDLLMWDQNKVGTSKYEKRARDHLRSINKLALSPVVPHYCLTGSADGDLRIWDIRTLEKSLIRIHHIQPVRTAVFSPSFTNPLQAIVGLDNGSIYRWDLKMGYKGQLDRIPVAHSGPILSLDWCLGSGDSIAVPPSLSRQDTLTGTDSGGSSNASGTGWLASGGMDRTVKVWDLNSAGNGSHISQTPTYTLFTSLPVRRALWRPDYDCELAIVSNAEFGTGTNQDVADTPTVDDALPTLSSSPEVDLGIIGALQAPRATDLGDPIEIWDVRRSYLAKWVVRGSTIEGGVVDAAFRDSHALWAVHSSGTFSQLDLRYSYRPIDAVPRTAVSWDAGGSLTFVADRCSKFEVPYDDINPVYKRSHPDALMPKKVLGDPSSRPMKQALGSVGLESLPEDTEVFEKLARAYIFEGTDKHTICEQNGKAALQAGHIEAAQIWMFAQSLYDPPLPPPSSPSPIQIEPESPPLSPLPLKAHPLPHSKSAPASIPTVKSMQMTLPPVLERPSTIDNIPPRSQPETPTRAPSQASSNSPSPRPPSPTPISPISIQSNLSGSHSGRSSIPFARRPSSGSILRPRALSAYIRPSMSSLSSSATPSLKHVGEGALDDSDSDSDRSQHVDAVGEVPKPIPDASTPADSSSTQPEAPRIVSSSYGDARAIASAPALPIMSPSPLSRQAWTEDSDGDGDAPGDADGDTPSPRSTDSDSSSGSVRLVARKSKSVSRTRRKRLSAPPLPSRTLPPPATIPVRPPMEKQASRSSIRTVVAAASEGAAEDRPASRAAQSVRSHRVMSRGSLPAAENLFSPSAGGSMLALDDDEDDGGAKEREERMQRRGWEAVREAVEGAAEGGDVQTAAMLTLVCAGEVKLSARRAVRIVESYVDLLNRLRLHAAAAYLRKFADYPDVQEPTQLQTTVYLTCGRCERPLLRPGGICPTCNAPSLYCAICRLPVRAMAFLCAICGHGGHMSCYRAYFAALPPVELGERDTSTSASSSRHRSLSRTSTGTLVDEALAETVRPMQMEMARDAAAREVEAQAQAKRPLVGRVCAAGCGHVCWVSNERVDE